MGIIFRNGRKYSGTRVVDDADHLFAEDTTGTSVSAQTMLSNILGDFATTEDSVAQENHSVGDYIVLGSYFYKVTDAITAGDTLVEGVNGNIERTNVGAEVAGIAEKSLAVTSGTCMQIANGTVGQNEVYKTGNILFISYTVSSATIAGNQGTVCQLRDGFKPLRQQVILAQVNYGGTLSVQALVVYTDGNIKTAIGSSTVTNVYIRSIPILLN